MDNISEVATELLKSKGLKAQDMEGVVVWLTGMSGAGKTTVGKILSQRFTVAGVPHLFLDGDVLRAHFAASHGHGRADRRRLAMSYGMLCREIASRGINVICATISLFHDVQDWNRKHIGRYVEIWFRVPIGELRYRDPKGIYAKAETGEIGDLVGIHIPAEWPRTPDLIVESHGPSTPHDTADAIGELLSRHPELAALSGRHGDQNAIQPVESHHDHRA